MKRFGFLSLLVCAGCLSRETLVNRAIVDAPPLVNDSCPPGPARFRLSESPADIKAEETYTSGLSHSEIHKVVRSNLKDIQACYQANGFGLSGYLKPRFYISVQGCVFESSIAESTIPSPELAACVKKRILSWKFPKPKSDRKIEIEYPILFKGNGENTVELPNDASEK